MRRDPRELGVNRITRLPAFTQAREPLPLLDRIGGEGGMFLERAERRAERSLLPVASLL